MCGLETLTVRSSDGMQVYYVGTAWVIQGSGSGTKEQPTPGYRDAKGSAPSDNAVWLVVGC